MNTKYSTNSLKEKYLIDSHRNSISSTISNQFGPQTKIQKLEMNRKVRKLIHYDCNNYDIEGIDDDVPDEDEVYIKENLLQKKDNITE
jgi:hypothetical protein